MGLKTTFANRKLAKLRKVEKEVQDVSHSISLGDSAQTESMKNHFPKEVATLLNYSKQVEDMFQYIKSNPECVYLLKDMDILPPFIVFPWLEPDSSEWENGGVGAAYADMFKRMMNQKSPNEIVEYCAKFPYPDWWIDSMPCHPVMYQEFWEMELAETGYDEYWRMALCKKYRDKYCRKLRLSECNGESLID